MASGSFNLTRTGSTSSYISFKCNWSSTTNVSANTSTVKVSIVASKSSGSSSSTWGTHNTSATVNGSSQSASGSFTLPAGGSVTLLSKTYTVPHNADGTKSTTISASVGGDVMWGSGSASVKLDTIPRASSVSGGSGNIGENTTISISRASSSFTHTLTYAFGNLSGTIATKTSSTSVNWTIPESFYAVIPNSNTGTGTITCTTYNGNTSIGTKTCSFTAKVVNGNPVFEDFTFEDTNTDVTDVTDNNQILVKKLSTLRVNISSLNKMVAQKSATPKNYVISIDNISTTVEYSANDIIVDLGVINSAGTLRLNIRAYDSRNNSTLVYKDIEVYDYEKPVINSSVTRLNNFEDETTLKVSGTFTKVTINNVEKNIITDIKYRYKETGGTWGNWITLTKTIQNNEYTCTDTILSLDNTKSFEFEVQAIDNLDSNTTTLSLDIGEAIFFIDSDNKTCYINGDEIIMYDIVDTW